MPARVNAWQYFWDTAEGVMTDMGEHYTDQMQWVLDTDDTGPLEFEAEGVFPDPTKFCSDTPITGVGHCKYANGVTGIMYQRGAFKDRYIRYIGDQGWIQVDDETDIVTAEPKSILSLKGCERRRLGRRLRPCAQPAQLHPQPHADHLQPGGRAPRDHHLPGLEYLPAARP